ncbi:Transposase [Phytophthora megakarya]|uniref:Transposase n=1 Tax=Phytophthora megakarya TaxID=4795 RepID=A0A225W1T8_9STRA|nr:Transposase [Phytophthora megakarya]
MRVDVMAKIEEYLDEYWRHTCHQMADRLRNDLGVSVTMNNITNKARRKEFLEALNKHVKNWI